MSLNEVVRVKNFHFFFKQNLHDHKSTRGIMRSPCPLESKPLRVRNDMSAASLDLILGPLGFLDSAFT